MSKSSMRFGINVGLNDPLLILKSIVESDFLKISGFIIRNVS